MIHTGSPLPFASPHDGSLHPNFKPIKMEGGFSVDGYADAVADELRRALGGLGEE